MRTAQIALGVMLLAASLPMPGTAQGFCNASFYVTNTEPYVGETITFTDDSAASAGAQVVQWAWDFGDAYTSTQQSPIHSFDHSGYFTVKLTMQDSQNCTDAIERIIQVRVRPGTTASNTGGPTLAADAGVDAEVVAGDLVVLQGRSSGASSSLVQYEWRQTAGTQVILGNATSATPSFRAPKPVGETPIKLAFGLKVRDGSSTSSEDVVEVTVRSRAVTLVVDAGGDFSAARGTVVVLDGSRSKASDGSPMKFAWRQVGGAKVNLTGADTSRPSFLIPTNAETPLEFILEVTTGTTTLSDSTRVFPTAPKTGGGIGIQADVQDRTVRVTALLAGGNITWDFGDGASAKGRQVGHLYKRDGNFTITMSLVDPTGQRMVFTHNVTVQAQVLNTSSKAAAGPAPALAAAALALAAFACMRRRARST